MFEDDFVSPKPKQRLENLSFAATEGHFSTRLNVHDHALMRAQLDTAVYGLVLAVPGGGHEQSPSQFT